MKVLALVLGLAAIAVADKIAPAAPPTAAEVPLETPIAAAAAAPTPYAAPAVQYSEPQELEAPVDSENYYYYYYPVEEEKKDIFAIKKEFLDNLDLKKVSIVVVVVLGILLVAPEIAALLGMDDLISTIANGVTGVTGRDLSNPINIRYDDVSTVTHMVLDAINNVY